MISVIFITNYYVSREVWVELHPSNGLKNLQKIENLLLKFGNNDEGSSFEL